MELFVTKNGMVDGNVLDEEQNRRDATVLKLKLKRQNQNGTGRLFFYSERNGTEWNGTGWNRTRRERLNERNGNRHNLSEGPCSRTERN